jgi:hypothetical protein
MNFLTHIMISKTLYRHLSQKMYIDQKAFFYGNIKPDLSPQCLRNPHILENYLFIVCNDSNQLINQNPPAKEFSVALGVICHYICDFFCYCHLDNKIYHKLLRHFIYEIQLHLAFCFMLMNHKVNISFGRKIPGKNIASMVIEMRKEYKTKQKTLQRDIEYAILTSLWACELILHFSRDAAEPAAAVSSV